MFGSVGSPCWINNREEGRWQPLGGFFHAVIYGMKVWPL